MSYSRYSVSTNIHLHLGKEQLLLTAVVSHQLPETKESPEQRAWCVNKTDSTCTCVQDPSLEIRLSLVQTLDLYVSLCRVAQQGLSSQWLWMQKTSPFPENNITTSVYTHCRRVLNDGEVQSVVEWLLHQMFERGLRLNQMSLHVHVLWHYVTLPRGGNIN